MPNRLAASTSPYLLQHADNPVDWWEWSPDAFAEAERRGVPVLLSVGYAACHWCHVMASRRGPVNTRPFTLGTCRKVPRLHAQSAGSCVRLVCRAGRPTAA